MSQAERYTHLAALTGRENNLDSAYHAAFYLLSCAPEVFGAARRCVTYEGIGFAKLKRATRDFDERSRFVIDIAHNLFSYYSPCKATPFEISRLGYPLMEQVCNALYIATEQVKVEIRQDENGQPYMRLDTLPYQRTQQTYAHFEQFQADMPAGAQGDGDEWER